MSYLPEAVRKGLEDARLAMLRRSSRLCVHDGDRVYRVTRLWDGGFAIAADRTDTTTPPALHGYVDLYDGPRHVYQCLVVASHEDEGERIFEFKWHTAVANSPALDFEAQHAAPAGYLGFHG